MAALNAIKEYIEQLDVINFKRYAGVSLGILVFISGFAVYRYYSKLSVIKKRITSINAKRRDVKEILERFEIVKIQQTEVDTLLAKDKDFKIGGYFTSLIEKLGLAQNKTREPETSSEVLDNGYTEVKLYASFSNLNTQKLTELLDTIEQTERIYTKEVEIYKPDEGQTINVNLLIATLEPKPESGEIAE